MIEKSHGAISPSGPLENQQTTALTKEPVLAAPVLGGGSATTTRDGTPSYKTFQTAEEVVELTQTLIDVTCETNCDPASHYRKLFGGSRAVALTTR